MAYTLILETRSLVANFGISKLVNKIMSLRLCSVFLFALFFVAVDSYTFENPKDNDSNAFLYLYKFGYIKFDQMNIGKAPEDILAGPIADFQAFAGLNVTGVLDTETIKLMKTPR